VALSPVPFAEIDHLKVRPVLILRHFDNEVTALPITTTRRSRAFGGEAIDWEHAGLLRQSYVVPTPIHIYRSDLLAIIGTLSDQDLRSWCPDTAHNLAS